MMENIKEFFLTFLPAQKTERYQRTMKALNSELLLPTLSLMVYTSNIFKLFMLLFQSRWLLIHILHICTKELVGDLLSKFFGIEFLTNILLPVCLAKEDH